MAGLTLDTGALIAAENGDRRFWAYWKQAIARDLDVTAPAPVVAQAWRGPRSARIALVLSACRIEPLDEGLAREVGVLCGRSGTNDIVDTAVVLSAARRGDDVLTGDPLDLRRLARRLRNPGRILDLNQLPAP